MSNGNGGNSELLASYQLPDGEKVRKFRDSSGGVSYRRSNGTYLSNKVGEGIEEGANRNVGDDRQVKFVVTPTTENDRNAAIDKRYPKINETKGLDPKTIRGNEPQIDRNTKGWMENETIKQDIRNDPLLKTRSDRRKALEARARQVVEDLKNAGSEEEAIEILKQYGIES